MDKSAGELGCWPWLKSNRNGYGIYWGGRRKYRATHISLFLARGIEIPDGLCALHRCDNPICVNPDHLFVGTHEDNVRDRDKKGRGRVGFGENHGNAKLTDEAVRFIRDNKGKITQVALGKMFGVSSQNVHYIQKNLFWKHVKPTEKTSCS